MIEQDLFYQKHLLMEAEQKLRPAKIILRIVGILNMIPGLIFIFLQTAEAYVGAAFFLGIGLGFLSISFVIRRSPKIGVIAGFILYSILTVFYILFGQFSGFLTIFMLIIFVPLGLWRLYKAIKIAAEVEKMRDIVNTLEGVNVPIDLI